LRTKSPEQAEKILVAAGRLFALHRFHEARMEDIAQAAGVGKGTLYRYFKDKEELYLALLDRAAAGLQRRIDEGEAAARCPRAKLEAVVGGILEYFDLNPYLFDLLGHAESRQHSGALENWQQLRVSNLHRVMHILEEGRREGLWDVPDPETPVLMLLGGLRAVLRFCPPPRPANLARRLVQDFLHGASRRRCAAEAGRG
jgi:TetR/AcrR family fatty acid metabolism transcriptional regulator